MRRTNHVGEYAEQLLTLAGIAAEADVLHADMSHSFGSEDWEYFLATWGDGEDFSKAAKRSRELARHYATSITALAEELLTHTTVSGERVHAIAQEHNA